MQLSEKTLDEILKGTSRAFYLSLAVLPQGARSPLSLAYLLARAADTIADTAPACGTDHLDLLLSLREAITTKETWAWYPQNGDWHNLVTALPESSSEKHLLQATPQLVELLRQRSEPEQEAIRDVVSTLIDGMVWDQRLFGNTQPERVNQGLDDADLERYTYLVAGCVGPFWSRVSALSDSKLQNLLDQDAMAIEFGKGLQWVNILRDIPADHRHGRYYLPSLQGSNFRQRFFAGSRRAAIALTTASSYPLLFPPGELRHRMAVFWPLVLGWRTLEKLWASGGPQPDQRVKVPRWEVLLWVALSPLLVSNSRLLSLTLNTLRRRAQHAFATLEDCDATTS